MVLASVFWGLWLFPLGYLALRSGFVPRAIGALLLVGGVAYLADCTLALFAPAARELAAPWLAAPLAAGELTMVGWLLVTGLRARRAVG